MNNVQTQTINSTTTTFSQNTGTNQLASMVTGATTTTVDTTSNGNIADFKIGGTAITNYGYNQANQMASATGPLGASATYEFGLAGQRLLKTPSSGYPITYQYGQAAKELLAENDLHSGQTADYIYMDPGRNSRPIGQVDPTSGNVYYTHTDRQGTPQAVTDSGQNVVWSAQYNPFGDTSSFSGTLTTQSLRLPGQYFDPETGNNHNGFRDYAGTLTRYVQSDPIGLGGGMNTFQYVRGNPFKYTDRLGLDPGPGGCGPAAAGAATTGGSCPAPPPPPPAPDGGFPCTASLPFGLGPPLAVDPTDMVLYGGLRVIGGDVSFVAGGLTIYGTLFVGRFFPPGPGTVQIMALTGYGEAQMAGGLSNIAGGMQEMIDGATGCNSGPS